MAEYSFYLKENHYVSDLLMILFNLLPLDKPLPGGDNFSYQTSLNLTGK